MGGMKAGCSSGTDSILARNFSRLKYGISESDGLFYVKVDCCSGKLEVVVLALFCSHGCSSTCASLNFGVPVKIVVQRL